jgi:hypothetical protein
MLTRLTKYSNADLRHQRTAMDPDLILIRFYFSHPAERLHVSFSDFKVIHVSWQYHCQWYNTSNLLFDNVH